MLVKLIVELLLQKCGKINWHPKMTYLVDLQCPPVASGPKSSKTVEKSATDSTRDRDNSNQSIEHVELWP